MHKAHKYEFHEKPGYTKSPLPTHSIVPPIAPSPYKQERGVFLRRSIRLNGKQTAAIDVSERGAIGSMISCRALGGDIRPAPFAFPGHFVLFTDIFAPFRDILRRCPQLPDHSRRSVLLAAIPCHVSKENRPAHRLGWTGRSRRERRSAVPNSHRASGGRLLERGVLEQKRSR